MRTKRLCKYRKERRKRLRRFFLSIFLMPAALVLIGYLVAALIILPSMSG